MSCTLCDCQQLKERLSKMLICGNIKALHHYTGRRTWNALCLTRHGKIKKQDGFSIVLFTLC